MGDLMKKINLLKDMDMKVYSKRVWLNKNDSSSTGSVVAYYGPRSYSGESQLEN